MPKPKRPKKEQYDLKELEAIGVDLNLKTKEYHILGVVKYVDLDFGKRGVRYVLNEDEHGTCFVDIGCSTSALVSVDSARKMAGNLRIPVTIPETIEQICQVELCWYKWVKENVEVNETNKKFLDEITQGR